MELIGMAADEAISVTLRVIRILESLGVPCLIGGSLASSLHGTPRSTLDGDVAADLRPEHVGSLVELLEGEFYVSEERVEDAVARRASFNVIHLATMFKVDVFVLDDRASSRAELERRERYRIGEATDQEAFVASAEDTVLQKLAWYRRGHGVSDRQWQDVLGVLRVQRGRLDREYLAEMAEEMGVADLLREALEEVG